MLERLGCSDMIGIVKEPSKAKDDFYNVVKFSMSNKLWRKNPTIADLFVYYFIDRCAEGYRKDKSSNEWAQLDPKERKQITNKYFRTKKVTQIMLSFCDNPPKRNDSGEFRSGELRILADAAHERIREEIGFPPGKVITQGQLFSSSLNEDFVEGSVEKGKDVENV